MEWYIPALIFLARICDVSIGTIRVMVLIAGHKIIAAVLGFVEVVIWVFAVGGALKFLPDPLAVVSYAGGFAAGTLVGMLIEERLALGYRLVRVIRPGTEMELSRALRAKGHRVTRVDGHGQAGPVEIAFMVVRRRSVPALLADVHAAAPDAYVTIERIDPPRSSSGQPDSRFRERPWFRLITMRK